MNKLRNTGFSALLCSAMALLLITLSAGSAFGSEKKKPCYKHTAHTKVSKSDCVKQFRLQQRRDRMAWPPNPTAADLRKRGVNIRGFARLGICEAGPGSGAFGVRWNTPRGWKWQGGLGMYSGTHRAVGHPYGSDAGQMTWQQQMLIGKRVADRWGLTAWDAYLKRPGACWG